MHLPQQLSPGISLSGRYVSEAAGSDVIHISPREAHALLKAAAPDARSTLLEELLASRRSSASQFPKLVFRGFFVISDVAFVFHDGLAQQKKVEKPMNLNWLREPNEVG